MKFHVYLYKRKSLPSDIYKYFLDSGSGYIKNIISQKATYKNKCGVCQVEDFSLLFTEILNKVLNQ
jgi:hypothetical protein